MFIAQIRLLAIVVLLTIVSVQPTCAEESNQANSFATLSAGLEDLVRQYYPKAKISKTGTTIHFEYKTKMFDIPQTDTIEAGPEWGGVLGDVAIKSLHLDEQVEKKLNNYSYYEVMEMHQNCKSSNNHIDARLGYPFDVQPEFLSSFKALIRKFDPANPPAPDAVKFGS